MLVRISPLLVLAICLIFALQTALSSAQAPTTNSSATAPTTAGTGTSPTAGVTATTPTTPSTGSTGSTSSGSSSSGSLLIDTPSSLVTCLPASITWHNAVPPVIIGAYPKGNIAATPYVTLPTQNQASGSYTWKVNLPAGVATTIGIRDGTGLTQNTAPRVIQNSTAASPCELVKVPDSAYDSGVTDTNITNSTTSGGVTSVTTAGTPGSSGTNTSSGTGVQVSNGPDTTQGTTTSSGGANAATTTTSDPIYLVSIPLAILAGVVGGAMLV